MDNNQRRRRVINIDGITQKSLRPNYYLNLNNKEPTSLPEQEIHEDSSIKKDIRLNSNQPSLLNTTMPNYNYSRQLPPKPIKPKKNKWSRKRKVLTTILVIILILFGVGFWYGSRIIGSLDKVFHGNVFSDIQGLFSSTPLKGESQGRVNILLAGYQGSESDEGPLTDSIMIVSIDTQNNTAFTMSVPRDLWLNIPNIGPQRINAANTNTSFNQQGYFKGGMGQLQQVVEQDFGIPIDYYALINYTAFEDAVNAVGGITVNIQSPDPRGLYDPNVDKVHGGPVKFPNGPVKLNGLQALSLAIARGDSPYSYGFPLSDINRTQHQRQMLIALEQKALTAGVLSNPVSVGRLFNALSNNVQTDLSLQNALRLVQLAKKVNISNIQSYGLNYSGTNALLTAANINGQDVLIPKAGLNNFSQIQHYYLQITSNSPTVRENASVVILNASTVNNIAHREETTLQNQGFDVVYLGNTSTTYPSSLIIDNSNGQKPSSKQYLQQTFSVTPVTTTSGSTEAIEGQGYTANFVVIIGQNWANKPTNL